MPPLSSTRTISVGTTCAALFIVLLNLWASWPVIGAYFIGDDFGYIHRFTEFPFAEWPSLFVRDWSGGMWGYELPELRPFSALSFLIDIRLWGPTPVAMHLTNVALAIGCAFAVGFLTWRMVDRNIFIAAGAAAIFSLHPSHAEPLGWITGRVDLLGTLCYLLSFIGALLVLEDRKKKTGFTLTWVAYFVGVFSKEFCLTLPVLLGLYLAVYRREQIRTQLRDTLILAAGYIAVFFVYWLCRHLAFGAHVRSGAASFDLLSPDYLQRQLSYLSWFIPGLVNLGRSLHASLLPSLAQLAAVATGLAITLVVLWRSASRSPTPVWRGCLFFGLIWYAIATIPLVAAGYFSPRHLFFATAGLAIATGIVVHQASNSHRIQAGILLVIGVVSVASLKQEIRPWMRAAKISHEAIAVLRRESPASNTVWIFDLPDTYQGCWTWSWAIPFCLQPPFLKNTPLATIEPPALYYAQHLWADPPRFTPAYAATEAVLFSFSPPLRIDRQVVPLATLRTALPILTSKSPGKTDQQLWTEFVAKIRSHD
jgi:hypothetical protein